MIILLVLAPLKAISHKKGSMDDKVAKFLEMIRMIESSGGKDINHPEISSGIHEGQSAYGSYGLMPNTIQELVNRKKLEQPLDQEYKKIDKEDPHYVKAVLHGNPELEQTLAKQMAERLLQRTGGDEEKAAYGWNMGHNTPVDQITPEKLDNTEYIKRFRALRQYGSR